MRLSKTTDYAIRILIDCATSGGTLVKVADISARREITLQNTFKIVHLLSRGGFIQAMRGRNGGVRLSRPATEIRIGDVVRSIEKLRLEIEADDEAGSQALDQLFDSALDAFIAVLDNHTLEDMARSSEKAGRLKDAGDDATAPSEGAKPVRAKAPPAAREAKKTRPRAPQSGT